MYFSNTDRARAFCRVFFARPHHHHHTFAWEVALRTSIIHAFTRIADQAQRGKDAEDEHVVQLLHVAQGRRRVTQGDGLAEDTGVNEEEGRAEVEIRDSQTRTKEQR